MTINTAVESRKINRDAKLNINQDFFIVQIVLGSYRESDKDLPVDRDRRVGDHCCTPTIEIH